MSSRLSVQSVTVRVPAKINLYLAVGAVRPDGFHDLTTVFHSVGLYDDVTVSRADALTVRVEGDAAADVPTDSTNLAHRAVVAMGTLTGRDTNLDVLIRKGIPVAGGCAGGSADAAAALVACDELWGLSMSRDELALVAAGLGSDVPFCLHGGTALGQGRGELLTPVLGGGHYWWVLALVEGGLSTPVVFCELDRLRESGPPLMASDPSEVLSALRQASGPALGRALSNDLQAAALGLRPELQELLAVGKASGALGGLVSGSGPTVAFLARDDLQAERVAQALAEHPVCRAVRIAEGPVPGARILKAS